MSKLIGKFYNRIIDIGWMNSSSAKEKRAKLIVERIRRYLDNSKRILDIGCGSGHIANLVRKMGKDITGVDIADKNEISEVKTVLYDGKHLPFSKGEFDTSLLLMVLHHTPKPEIVFREAARVSKKIIVIEDIHNNLLGKILLVSFDSLQNKPLKFFWNSYKNDSGWRTFFKKQGYKIISVNCYSDIPYFHCAYYLEKRC